MEIDSMSEKSSFLKNPRQQAKSGKSKHVLFQEIKSYLSI
jgi:hypothetical protein